MKDVIGKACSQLVSNPHVIGIILNCGDMFRDIDNHRFDEMVTYSNDFEENEMHVDMCVISKETGNQKTIYMEDGVVVCLRWNTVDTFCEQIADGSESKERQILYDRTGLLRSEIDKNIVRFQKQRIS